ncbi:MAG: YkgJ family cysteine cluster protein [bacterium]|nr:YkgJ family cysteine cluster protein [bacterium]
MNAEENLKRISDGRLYGIHDMAKVGCHDCAGCSRCCRGMGESVVLDPYDAYQLTKHLGQTFEQLLSSCVELHVADGLIVPNLVMRADTDACTFLDENGRCRIHAFRPGLCRIFPLGRNYEGGTLTYFVLKEECPMPNKTKVKIEKWLDTPDLQEKQAFLTAWHALLKRVRRVIAEGGDDKARAANVALLQTFYFKPYRATGESAAHEFYEEFYERLATKYPHCG